MKIARTGWMMCLAASLAACGGGEAGAEDAAALADGSAPAAASSPPPAGRRGPMPAVAPVPTAADSAAALREDVSPEWKMNERNMAPYADCMKQANSVPEPARARLAEACGNLPDAP